MASKKLEREIHSIKELTQLVKSLYLRFDGEDFVPLRVIMRPLKNSKTPAHHRYLFRCINEMHDAWIKKRGDDITKETLRLFIKYSVGFTEMMQVEGRIVELPKSIADNSDHVDSVEITKMVEFIKRYTAQELDFFIED